MIIILSCGCQSIAQYFVHATEEEDNFLDYIYLQHNMLGCKAQKKLPYPPTNIRPRDGRIAITPDSTFFLFSGDREYMSAYRYNGTDFDIVFENYFPPFGLDDAVFGATYGQDGWIYLGKRDLWRFNTTTGIVENLNVAKPTSLIIADATRHKGELFYIEILQPTILQLNKVDDSFQNITLVKDTIELSGLTPALWMQSVQCHCEDVKLLMYFGNRIYEYNFNTGSIEEICELQRIESQGVRGEGEFFGFPEWSECALSIDLDLDDEEVQKIRDYNHSNFCGHTGLPLSDDDVQVYASGGKIDSIVAEIINPAPSQYIIGSSLDQISIQGDGSSRVVLVGEGMESFDDYENAIRTLRYIDDAAFSGPEIKQVKITAYRDNVHGQIATAFLDITEASPTAGDDIIVTVCNDAENIDLNDYLSSDVSAGSWDNSTGIINAPIIEGDYDYIVTGTSCPSDTAHITVQLHPDAIVDRQMYNLCPGDSILYAGRYYTEATMLSDTIYAVESGCDSVYTEVEISILSQATVVQIDTSLCYGDQLEIDNQMYDSEGSYIHTLSSQQSGCDSIAYEINLEIIPEASRIMIDTILCTGESITIGSLTIDRDTVSEIIIKDLSQCDSIIYVLDVQIAEVKNVVIDTILCNGQSIEIEGILYDSATQDQIIISDQQGCDSIIYDLNILIEETVMIMDQQYEIEANVPTVVSIEVLSNDDNIIWQPSIGLSCDDCLSPKVTLDMDQEYVVTLMSEEGCSQEIIVNVLVNQVTTDKSDYYVANIIDISSNDNDVLYVQSSESMMTYSMTIFDRWGSVVYDRKDILVNDKSQGWNGMYNNQAELSQGIYVYKIEMEDGDVLVGDVMHVR